MRARPSVVAFDVIGILFPIEPLREPLVGLGLPPQALEIWFARTLRDGFALAASGMYQPFTEVATGTLDGLLAEHGRPENPSGISDVFSHFARLPSRPDAGAALNRLQAGGVRVLTLTNGSEKNTRSLLQGSGLDGLVERIVSIDEPQIWKPRSELYLYAARVADVDPARMALVAAHAWDCRSASRAGLVTGWVSQPEMKFNPALGQPDVQGETLSEVADKLIGLSSE